MDRYLKRTTRYKEIIVFCTTVNDLDILPVLALESNIV